MSDTQRHDRIEEYLKETVAEYIARETNKTSLITVTRVELAQSLKKAQIMVTVYPEDKEDEVLHFLQRKGADIRGHVKKRVRTRVIPFLEFMIDEGEKKRQKIDALLQ